MAVSQIRRMFCLNRVENPGESLSRKLATRGDGGNQASDCLARQKKMEFSFPTAPVL